MLRGQEAPGSPAGRDGDVRSPPKGPLSPGAGKARPEPEPRRGGPAGARDARAAGAKSPRGPSGPGRRAPTGCQRQKGAAAAL